VTELPVLKIESRELRRQCSSLLARPENFIHGFVQRILGKQMREDDPRLLADHGEQMAELVGQAARNAAEGLHFLGLEQLPLQSLPL
jgi:hypothetical protein